MSSSVKRRKTSGDEPAKIVKKSKTTAPVAVDKPESPSPEPEVKADIAAEDDIEVTKTFKDLVRYDFGLLCWRNEC